MALMKKFKVEGIGRVEQVERELSEAAVDQADIDYLVSMLRLVFLLSHLSRHCKLSYCRNEVSSLLGFAKAPLMSFRSSKKN